MTAICDDAYAGALTATWSHLTTLLRDPNPARLAQDLRSVAVCLQQEHAALRDTFDIDLADPTLPAPPSALYKPVDVSAMIEKLIIEPLDQGKPPDRVHQRDIARTRDYYNLQNEWFHPDVTQCPDRLSPTPKKNT